MTTTDPSPTRQGTKPLPGRERPPGGALRHPVILFMLVLWAVNDHVLKSALANTWTGKLSDVASLAVFPLLPLFIYQLGCSLKGARAQHANAVLLVSLIATGAVMVGINISDLWADSYRVGLGAAQWPFRCIWGLIWEGTAPPLRHVLLTMDPTDLWTLPALALPWWIGRAHLGPPEQETSP